MRTPFQSTTTLVATAIAAALVLGGLVHFAFFGTSAAVRAYQHGLSVLDRDNDEDKLGKLYWAATQADPQFEWKMPIAFYGKVVDEHGNPVSGAKIEYCWNDLSREGTSKRQVLSDDRGLFSLEGVRGKYLTVGITKEGYRQRRSPNEVGFEYSNCFAHSFHRPDPARPVVFHLLKKNVAQPLLHRDFRVLLYRDGSPVCLDLLRGKTSDQGHMEIRMWKSTRRDGFKFDWRIRIRIPDGGLIDTGTEYSFTAPATGYSQVLDINMLRSSQVWRQMVNKKLCFVFGNPPKYGRMDFDVNGNHNFVRVELWINPSGSQNLEYDSFKDISQQFE